MTRRLVLLGMAVLVVLAAAGETRAVVVTSSANGVELDSGGFEAETVDTLPAAPTSGTWLTRPDNTTDQVAVFGPDSPGPGAAQGDQYVRLQGNGIIAAQVPGLTTGTVQGRTSIFYPTQSSGVGSNLLIFSSDATGANFGDRVTWLAFANASDFQQYVPEASTHPAGHAALAFHDGAWHWVTTGGGTAQMSFPFDQWVDVQVDLDIDTGTYTITTLADGVTSDPMSGMTGVAVNSFAIRTNGGPAPIFYADGIGDNDSCADARAISAGTATGSTVGSTNDGSASCGGSNDVWFRYHALADGALAIDTCGSNFDTVLSLYTGACGSLAEVACNNNCGGDPCNSSDSCLRVPISADTMYWIRLAGAAGATGDFSLNVSSVAVPENDDCATATAITAAATTGYTLLATSDGPTPSCGNSAGSPDVWYSWTAPQDGFWVVDACNSALDTSLAIYTGECGALTEIACEATSTACAGGGGRLEVAVTAGTTYLVRVAGNNAQVGDFVLHSQFGTRIVRDFLWEADGQTLPQDLDVTTAQCDGTQTQSYGANEEYYVNTDSPGVCAMIAGWPFGSDIIDYNQMGGHFLTARLRIHEASGLDSGGVEDIGRGAVMVWMLADDRFGDYREPAIAVTQTGVYRMAGRGPNDQYVGELLPTPPGFDPTASFNDYTVQYDASTDMYEYLLNGQLLLAHSRSQGPPRGATPAGLRVGDAVSGRSTPLNWDMSRIEFGPGVIQKADCTGNLLNLWDGTLTDFTAPGAADAWYDLIARASGQLFLDTCGSSFDTILRVLDDCGGTVLASNEDCPGTPCGPQDSCLNLPVTAGTYYKVHVSGVGGATGDYALTVDGPPVNGVCAGAVALPGDGAYSGSTVGAPSDGTASCGGNGGSDVWFTYTAAANGMASVDTCGSQIPTVVSVYTGTCGGLTEVTCSTTCSDPCTSDACVSWSLDLGTTYYIRVAGTGGAAGVFNLNLSTLLAPPNDDCMDAQEVSLGQYAGTTVNGTSEGDTPSCGNTAGAPDVWYKWTANGSGTLIVDTCYLPGMDTVVSVYTGTCGAFQEIACNDNCAGLQGCFGPSSCVAVDVTEDETYYIRVAGNGGLEAEFGIRLTADLTTTPLAEAIVVARNGRIVWQDDGFEDDTPGTAPNAPDLGGYGLAGPLQVYGPESGGPGAHLGDNYLRIARDGGNPEYTVQLFDLQDGQEFAMSFAFNSIAAGPNLGLRRAGTAFPASYIQLFYFWGPRAAPDNFPPAGTITYYVAETGHTPSGLTFTPGTWFTVKMSWVVGSATMDLTVDDSTVTIPVFQPAGPLDRLTFATGLGGTAAYVDAAPVPELDPCGPITFDSDSDRDVDLIDFSVYQICHSGDGEPYDEGCGCFDWDEDGDVDGTDLLAFELCSSGPEIPADPNCDN